MSRKEKGSTILVGSSSELFAFYSRLKRPAKVLGVFCQYGTELPEGLLRIGDTTEAPGYIQENAGVKRVYCCITGIGQGEVEAVQNGCKARAVKLCVVVPMLNEMDADFVSIRVGKSMVLTPKNEPLTHLHNRLLKRVFDCVAVLLFMLTLFPFIYIFKAIVIKRKARGSSFATCLSVGPNNRVFKRIGFRGNEESFARVFNVLKGNMSLVGPACYEIENAADVKSLPARLERPHMKSGMTGWAQVKKLSDDERLEADIWYAEHWSFWLDLRILFMSMF